MEWNVLDHLPIGLTDYPEICPGAAQVGQGGQSGNQLVLEQGPGSVATPGLADHLDCDGEEPLQYVLGAWRSVVPPSPVPRAGGPHQQGAANLDH